MVGLIGLLAGEILYEAARFILMLVLLVCAVFIGGKLRGMKDAKEARNAVESKDSLTK